MNECVARQPILNSQQKLYGYELLFRSGPENVFGAGSGDQATASVISQALTPEDLRTLTDGKKCFVNITRRILLDELYTLLPKENIVLELPESIQPDQDIVQACEKVRRAGYALALDDYALEDHLEPLLPLLNILKVDFVKLNRAQRKVAAEKAATYKLERLAEKVETRKDFTEAASMGYELYQGYFFCEPEMRLHRGLNVGQIAQLQLLEQIHRPKLELNQIETLIREDLGLSYKLLRFLNSAAFSFRTEITSIKRALVLLGERPLRKWASLILLSQLAGGKPQQLLSTYLVRAKFCEFLGSVPCLHNREDDLFTLGMFSLIDAILDQPMPEIVEKLAINDEIKAALLGEQVGVRSALDLTIALEQGRWSEVAELAAALEIDDVTIARAYQDSIAWAASLRKSAGASHAGGRAA